MREPLGIAVMLPLILSLLCNTIKAEID